MRYVRARIDAEMRDLLYRVYITDSIKLYVSENKCLADRWYDRAFEKWEVDTRTGDEIALDVITRAGLKFKP